MRDRQTIESDVTFDNSEMIERHNRLILEVLLDIREQNQELITMMKKPMIVIDSSRIG